ncbi:TPA: hypothetical protein [Aquificae Joseph's Coat Spring virus]|nr:TPA: hypothetical protein [Aquificae Joseph's Coat Spring virus]
MIKIIKGGQGKKAVVNQGVVLSISSTNSVSGTVINSQTELDLSNVLCIIVLTEVNDYVNNFDTRVR